MNPYDLVPLTLTHVQYKSGSRFHLFLAYASLFPILQLYTYNILIFYTRELTICNVYMGQLLNEFFNLALKKTIKQPRPTKVLGGGYGMPSSHAQFVAYLATFIILHLERRVRLVGDPTNLYKRLYQGVVTVGALLVGYSRIELGYHTPYQVSVGLTLGVIFGCLYFVVTEEVLRSRYPVRQWILESQLGRWTLLRDTWNDSNENEKASPSDAETDFTRRSTRSQKNR